MTSALLEPSALACPPRFGTPRDLSRPTLGPAVGRVAELLGRPLMPWQQYVADVALEIDPATGLLVYDEVGLTVPRQSGKTTLKLSKATHRCTATGFFGRRQHVVYTAQTRKDARKKFIEEFWPDLDASATFAGRAKPHWGNGDEHIRFANGSWFGIEATTEKAGHGGVLDEAYIDEAFAQVDDRLEQAFDPAMVTRRNKQLWIVSTAGWLDASPFLLDKVRIGREHVTSGASGRLAYFEWSADPDADPADEAEWWRCMPALGHTIGIEAIRSALEKAERRGNLNGFRRAYLNQWVKKDAPADAPIDLEVWASLADRGDQRPSPVVFSVEVSEDREWSSIGLAGRRPDGRVHVQIVETGRKTGWVAGRVAELVKTWKPLGVAVNPSSPAGSLLGALASAGVDVVKVGGQELAQACGLFADKVDDGTLAHTAQPQVATAIGAAVKAKSGSAWVWKPKDDTDISPLWAETIALHALDRMASKKARSGRVW